MTVKELIKILQELDPNSKAMIRTENRYSMYQEVEQVQESVDADYDEIYIMGVE
jgi:isochorismate hydrolase